MTSVPHGTVEGDTWTYTDEALMGGQKIKSRVTEPQTPQTPQLARTSAAVPHDLARLGHIAKLSGELQQGPSRVL